MVWYFFRHFIFSERAGSLIRRIAWLSVIGITISVTAFLVVLFVMNGMNRSIQERVVALEPHLFVHDKEIKEIKLLEQHPIIDVLDQEDIQYYFYESQDVILRTTEGQFRGAIARGVTSESLSFLFKKIQELNERNHANTNDYGINVLEDLPAEGEVILGIDLARSLGVYEGDYITVLAPEGLLLPPGETPNFEKVRVKRIVSMNLSDLDSQYMFYTRGLSLNAFQRTASRQVGIELWLHNPEFASDFKKSLSKFDNFKIETWMERNSALFFALKLEKIAIGIFLGLAGLIAGSSILTVLALLLSQKKREIAILRAIGLSAKRTVQIFTQMGILLSASGVLAGIILGMTFGFYVEKNPINLLPEIYYDSQIPAEVNMWLVFFVLVVGFILAFLGSWLPARTALEIEPSQALRVKN